MTLPNKSGASGTAVSRAAITLRPRWRLLAALLLGLLLLPCGLIEARARARSQALEAPPPGEISFQSLGRFEPAGGVVQDAVWQDSDHLLVLALGPQGAELLSAGFNPSRSTVFMGGDFISANICPPALHDRLSLQLSPAGRYLAFHWFTDSGERRAALVDLSVPGFQLVALGPPPGMQVQQLLFSPDDRYVVLTHDGYKEGSTVSMLVLDLQTSTEAWRLAPHDLNFIHAAWWGSDPLKPGFALSAEVHNGEFQAGPGIARFDLASHQWDFTPEKGNLLLFSEAPWGAAAAYQSAAGAQAPYYLKFSPAGGSPAQQKGQLLLNSEPVGLELLPDSNYALLVNRSDASSNQLWQVNLASAKRYLVDNDCRRCELGPAEHLLVVAGESNAVKLYRLKRPGESAAAPDAAAAPVPEPPSTAAEPGDKEATDAPPFRIRKRNPGRQPQHDDQSRPASDISRRDAH